MKQLHLFATAIFAVLIAFTSCSSDDNGPGSSFVDEITGNYTITVDDTEQEVSITKAGDAMVQVTLYDFNYNGYTFGDIATTCIATNDEESDIYFAGSTDVTATRAYYHANCSISGRGDGEHLEIGIIITGEEMEEIYIYAEGNVSQDNNENDEEDNVVTDDEELFDNIPVIAGEWTAVKHNGEPVELPYSMTMYIDWNNRFESYKHIPNADGSVTTEAIEGEWVWMGWDTSRVSIVVENRELTYFILKSIDSSGRRKMETIDPDGNTTIWELTNKIQEDW